MLDNYETQRTIEEVFDLETGEIINSKDFFEKSESEIIAYRRVLQEAINGYSKPKFVCLYCNQLLKLSGISTRRGMVSFFAHLHDSDECEIKTDGNNLSKEQIEILKYSKVRESERHKYLKNKIYKCLTDESSALNGVKGVEVEKRIVSKLPYFNWRQPDISFEYRGNKIVLELQLSTTFLGVVIERDIFYKMNGIFIIWVFNFSENQQYVNLGNLMCKDIYYANKRNAFIYDKESMELSELKKELILKCVWFEPKTVNGVFDPIKSIRKEEFISLTDLKFDTVNYKPYYINADLLFDKHQPSLKVQRQEEEMRIQKNLNKQIRQRDIILTPFDKQIEWGFKNYKIIFGFKNESGNEVIPAQYSEAFPFKNGISWVRKTYWGAIDTLGHRVVNFQFHVIRHSVHNDYIIATNRKGKSGILSNDGFIIAPFEFIEIEDFVDGKVKAKKNSGWGELDEQGNPITKNKIQIGDDVFKGERFDLFGLETREGAILLPFYYSKIGNFVNGISKATKNYKDGFVDIQGNEITENKVEIDKNLFKGARFELWGIEDESGFVILPFEYPFIGNFIDGYAIARDTNGLCGVIDLQGVAVIPFSYEELGGILNGIITAKKKDNWGIINIIGETLAPFEYNILSFISANRIRALQVKKITSYYDVKKTYNRKVYTFRNENVSYKNTWGVIDSQGIIVFPFVYDSFEEFIDGKAKAQKDGNWGFIDLSGEVIIPFQYASIKEFVDGRAKAKKDGKWGFIDPSGKVIIPFEYNSFKEFVEGRAIAEQNTKWGVINTVGETVIPFEYNSIEEFIGGKAKAQKAGNWGFVDLKGEIIIPFEYDSIKEFIDGKAKANKDGVWGYIDEKGVELITDTTVVREDILKGHKFGKWGIDGIDGKNILPFEYDSIEEFIDGKAKAQINWKWGVVNLEGEIIIPFEYDSIEEFIDGNAKAQINSKWGVINLEGKTLIPFDYESIEECIDGRVKAKKDWNWGYIDLSGKVIIPFEYYSIGHFIEGKAKAQKITEVFPSSLGGYSGQLKWGIIDQNGFEIISFIYTHIDDIIDGKAKVKFGEKWGYINDEGKELIPCLYEQLGDFNDGKAKVKKSGKWGIADTNGNIIIQLEYEQIDKFDGDKLSAKKGNKLGIIDFTGKIILPFEYDQINDLIDGEAKVYKENRWGLIDGNGNIIIEDATKIAPGLLKGTKFGKWGIAKIDGKIIIPFEFDEIDDFIDGKIRVKTANHWGVIDENGKVLVEENSEIAPGLFKGKMFGRWGVALTSGAIIIPYEYDVICKIKIGLIKVCLHGKWGVFEANGTQFLPTIYSEIDICSTNKIIKGKKESWGCLDQKGTEILPFLYESVTCSDGKILAIKNKHLETTKYAVVREKVNVSVSAISSFGVFLRFGSIDGLLHISSIVNAGKLISDFKVGDQTQVFIESINEHLQRISFSLLQNNALGIDTLNKHTAFDLCEIGNFYSGKIASIKDYGLFVQLNENIVGLLHISEIKKKNHLLDDYKKGDKIDVLIISLDKVRKRIMLSYYEGN